MNTDEHRYLDPLTEREMAAVFEVSNTLGAGFLEKVYQRALLPELELRGIPATAQASFGVSYTGCPIVVNGVLVMQLKCVERLANQHTAPCLNDLRASGLGLCLLVNFQNPKVEGKRIIQGFHAPDRIGDAPS
jgi:GxxExxY protein